MVWMQILINYHIEAPSISEKPWKDQVQVLTFLTGYLLVDLSEAKLYQGKKIVRRITRHLIVED